MDGLVVVAALLSAFFHAAWNAAVKAAPDPRGAMAAQVVASGIAAAPFLVVLPLPPPAALPWLAASAVCNLFAALALARGYAGGGFGFVYPLARAVSPVLVTILAWVLAGEELRATGLGGVVLVSTGVALFAAGRGRPSAAVLGSALAAGVFSAGYAVCDAQGVRLSSSTVGYGLTVSALNAAVFGSVHRLRVGESGSVRAALAANPRVATFGAAAAMLSYLLILWVWERTQIAVGAALRDTSIAFAALIAVVVLDEPMNRTRVAAVALVAAGAGVLRFA